MLRTFELRDILFASSYPNITNRISLIRDFLTDIMALNVTLGIKGATKYDFTTDKKIPKYLVKMKSGGV